MNYSRFLTFENHSVCNITREKMSYDNMSPGLGDRLYSSNIVLAFNLKRSRKVSSGVRLMVLVWSFL